MAAKQMKFDTDARAEIAAGLYQLARAVKATLGPRGRNVVFQKSFGSPRITKDGVTVSKEIELPQPFENMGAKLINMVASKTGDVAGDGTTTAVVLAEAIMTEGMKYITSGVNPVLVQRGIVKAVQDANANLSKDDCRFFFHLGEEKTVGQNSRQLLPDGQIYWIGPRTNFVRATGPFDPDLPVLAFRDANEKLRALIFNHSTHTIGTRLPGHRSPSFYGLAAQEIEAELGGAVCFLEGASGSTHNLNLSGDEATKRIKQAVADALAQSKPQAVPRLAALKRSFKFKVRDFDEAREDAAVVAYCRKYAGTYGDTVVQVFRDMRKSLAPQRGQERETWLQVLLVGDVAIVGVPAEYFTQLGLDIKNRSPFRNTCVAELANDWIGYLPNLEGHKLGGYQVWTGYHSYAEPGTGERIADEAVKMLKELAK